jgi:hypothetical protein
LALQRLGGPLALQANMCIQIIMAKSNIRKQKKRGRGRPPKPGGLDPVVSARLPHDLVAEIDEWAAENEAGSRQDAVRALVERGLKAKHKQHQGGSDA